MKTIQINKATQQFLQVQPAHSSFSNLRKTGLEILEQEGLPHIKEEEYKFTSISRKIEQQIQDYRSASSVKLSADQVSEALFSDFEGDIIVFNNGRFEPSLSRVSDEGYTISTLSEAASALLGTIANPEADPFIALNNLFFEDGIFLKVPKGSLVQKPIFLLHFNQAQEGQAIHARVLIEVEDQAEVTLLENTISLDEAAYFSNTVTEVKVGSNAHAHYYRLQNENKQAIVTNNFVTDIHRSATFTTVATQLSGDMLRNNLSLNLLESGCEGNMYGLYLLNGKTHVDNHTNVDHTKPHADSNELYKGILADSSRGVFNGKIFVRQDAQKTNAFQQNNNILLSEDAIINTKPQLEIWADDVKCSHGCTTGQLDEEALFYLQARGIGKDQARGLLLYAFAGEVLDHIAYEPFKAYCIEMVQERLGTQF
ncbi:Fe-S cluster assembly protein SufD [Belliella kenyensis]|uniref:Fe-S cluster assembly protein SufD n=1 Tax=Belliella kenyensis TaxID=1472724 RepID=A0ABV8EN17_9BACT|nr:Fe-S cluster assembly protein SufD [Belliella kenyensis]MCH7403375.1 Fe-S cluster assembly protein SufD [Belliella kenyensis]MDN3601587.1 Fe-S cluster assembly protein SufD [Belliella kenyensis]